MLQFHFSHIEGPSFSWCRFSFYTISSYRNQDKVRNVTIDSGIISYFLFIIKVVFSCPRDMNIYNHFCVGVNKPPFDILNNYFIHFNEINSLYLGYNVPKFSV